MTTLPVYSSSSFHAARATHVGTVLLAIVAWLVIRRITWRLAVDQMSSSELLDAEREGLRERERDMRVPVPTVSSPAAAAA